MKNKKILVVASNSAHTLKYLSFIKNEFKDILVVSNNKIEGYDGSIKILKGNIFSKTIQFKKILRDYKPDFIHFHNLTKE